MKFIAFLEGPPRGKRGNWGVFFPDLPGCTSGGRTFEQAAANAREALAMHLAGMAEDGERIPQPKSLTEIAKDQEFAAALLENGGTCVPQIVSASPTPSKRVRVNVTIDERLLIRVDKRAETEGMTRSRMIEDALVMVLDE